MLGFVPIPTAPLVFMTNCVESGFVESSTTKALPVPTCVILTKSCVDEPDAIMSGVVVVFAVALNVFPSNVRLDSTVALGEEPSRVIIPLLVEPVRRRRPEVPALPEDPLLPLDPEDPDVPDEPEVPLEPEDPLDPELPPDPEDPLVPADPDIPLDPLEPDVPEDPLNPELPEDPLDPDEPELPLDPIEPLNPDDPLLPDVPEEPSVPETPLLPADPLEPLDPALPVAPIWVYITCCAVSIMDGTAGLSGFDCVPVDCIDMEVSLDSQYIWT